MARSRQPKMIACPYCGAMHVAAMPVCPQCAHSQPGAGRRLLREAEPETRSFPRELLHAFVYPLSLGGIIAIAISTLLMAVLPFLEHQREAVPWIQGILYSSREYAVTTAAALVVMFVFFEAVQSSAGGLRKFPLPFGDSGFDWYESLYFGIEGVLVSYLPAFTCLLVTLPFDGLWSRVLFEVLRAAGCWYLPMALLSLAVWRDPAAVSPRIVLPLIRKIPRVNALAMFILWIANTLHVEAVRWTLSGEHADLVGYAFVLAAYLYFVCARVIGIAHWVYRQEIGWFRYD